MATSHGGKQPAQEALPGLFARICSILGWTHNWWLPGRSTSGTARLPWACLNGARKHEHANFETAGHLCSSPCGEPPCQQEDAAARAARARGWPKNQRLIHWVLKPVQLWPAARRRKRRAQGSVHDWKLRSVKQGLQAPEHLDSAVQLGFSPHERKESGPAEAWPGCGLAGCSPYLGAWPRIRRETAPISKDLPQES